MSDNHPLYGYREHHPEEENMMPVLIFQRERKENPDCPKEIPMRWLNEQDAIDQHSQTLNILKKRGGLGPTEIWANITGNSIFKTPTQKECIDFIIKKLRDEQHRI